MRRRSDLPFEIAEYESRLFGTRRAMEQLGIDVLAVSTPENICYLTGYNSRGYYSHQCLFIPLEAEPWIVTRLLDAPNVEHQSWLADSVAYRDEEDPISATAASLRDRVRRTAALGVELGSWFFGADTYLRFEAALPGTRLADASGAIERLRMVKSHAELALIRKAAKAVDAGMLAAINATRSGVRDSDIAAAAYHARILAGSEYVASPVYVQTGPQSAVPHNNWNGRLVRDGDVVFYEMGASVNRYHAALMRTSVVGKANEAVGRAGAAVVEALAAAIAAIKPGVTAGEVDAAGRRVTTKAGYGENHTLRIGYPIGIGYPPTWVGRQVFGLNHSAPDRLEAGMVFHVIPWIHVPGVGGFGNSATVVVSASGCESLTTLESKLFER